MRCLKAAICGPWASSNLTGSRIVNGSSSIGVRFLVDEGGKPQSHAALEGKGKSRLPTGLLPQCGGLPPHSIRVRRVERRGKVPGASRKAGDTDNLGPVHRHVQCHLFAIGRNIETRETSFPQVGNLDGRRGKQRIGNIHALLPYVGGFVE